MLFQGCARRSQSYKGALSTLFIYLLADKIKYKSFPLVLDSVPLLHVSESNAWELRPGDIIQWQPCLAESIVASLTTAAVTLPQKIASEIPKGQNQSLRCRLVVMEIQL